MSYFRGLLWKGSSVECMLKMSLDGLNEMFKAGEGCQSSENIYLLNLTL